MPGFAGRATNATAFNPMQSSVPFCDLCGLCVKIRSGWVLSRMDANDAGGLVLDSADRSRNRGPSAASPQTSKRTNLLTADYAESADKPEPDLNHRCTLITQIRSEFRMNGRHQKSANRCRLSSFICVNLRSSVVNQPGVGIKRTASWCADHHLTEIHLLHVDRRFSGLEPRNFMGNVCL